MQTGAWVSDRLPNLAGHVDHIAPFSPGLPKTEVSTHVIFVPLQTKLHTTPGFQGRPPLGRLGSYRASVAPQSPICLVHSVAPLHNKAGERAGRAPKNLERPVFSLSSGDPIRANRIPARDFARCCISTSPAIGAARPSRRGPNGLDL